MSLKKILEEEAAMEKAWIEESNPVETKKETAAVIETSNVELRNETTPTEPKPVQESRSFEEILKELNTSNKRYNNFKASTDLTISNLRKENIALVSKLQSSNTKIDELSWKLAELQRVSKDPLEGAITQEERDLIGSEAVDVIQRTNKLATEAAINPLKEEIRQLKAKELANIKRDSEARVQAEYNLFIADLGKVVPDYAAINLDSNFEKFMLDFDTNTGEKRLDSFRRAEEYRDVYRVADFFNEYKASIPKSKREVLEDKVSVDSSKSSNTPISNSKKETFTVKEVEKFYDDLAKGLYRRKNKEAEEIEARIEKAYMNDRIVR